MTMRNWQYVMVALGVFLWIIAIFLMVDGGILGARAFSIMA